MIVRDATPSDAGAIAQLHALSWRSAYRGILSDEYLDNFADDDRRMAWRMRFRQVPEGPWLLRLAVEGERTVGFMCVILDADERWGALLDNLHVSPEMKGRGLGRMLMAQAVDWVLDQRPSCGLHLWVYEANHPARGFYDRFGGEAVERLVQRACDGNDVPFLRYAWPDLAKLQKDLQQA